MTYRRPVRPQRAPTTMDGWLLWLIDGGWVLPVAPARAPTCSTCRGSVGVDGNGVPFAHCYKCGFNENGTGYIDTIVPISYSVERGLESLIWLQKHERRYRWLRQPLGVLLFAFLDTHLPCIEAQVGPIDHATVVPSHPSKRDGWDHMWELVRGRPELDAVVPWNEDILRCVAVRPRGDRRVRDDLYEASRDVADQTVLLVDDTLTTGATVGSAALALIQARANRVAVVTLGRQVRQTDTGAQIIDAQRAMPFTWPSACSAPGVPGRATGRASSVGIPRHLKVAAETSAAPTCSSVVLVDGPLGGLPDVLSLPPRPLSVRWRGAQSRAARLKRGARPQASLPCCFGWLPGWAQMDTARAREILRAYGPSVAYVEVQNHNGDVTMGSAFHVGDGVFVTAAHVLRDMQVLSVATTLTGYVPYLEEHGEPPLTTLHEGDQERLVHYVEPRTLVINRGPHYHSDPKVDLAIFGVEEVGTYQPVLQLGDHLDDWLGEIDFVLSAVVLLGYPPVPMSNRASIFATRAEVNAVIDRYDAPHAHFVVGSLPRGGFSGGPAVSEWGQVLGVIVQSLLRDGAPPEAGYVTVLGVEAIYGLLADHRMLPPEQSAGWQGFWNEQVAAYGEVRGDPEARGGRLFLPSADCEYVDGLAAQVLISHAEIGVFDDGYALEVYYRVKVGDWAARFKEILSDRVPLDEFSMELDENGYQRFRAPVPVSREVLLEVYAAANRMISCLKDAGLQWTASGSEGSFTPP